MRWYFSVSVLCLFVVFMAGILYLHKDRIQFAKTPPASLQQWYKPENKRQVWLHNMFKLRREIQAVRGYANDQNPENLAKWSARLSEHYLKIAEMVPEWKNRLDLEVLNTLQQRVETKQYPGVVTALDDLGQSCDSCHDDYRTIVATLYRAPDFSAISISPTVTYQSHMNELIIQVNQIKIASEDGDKAVALSSFQALKRGMDTLNTTCINCHKEPTKTYPDAMMTQALDNLESSLQSGTLKDQGLALGTLAVQACANCHSTHRLSSDARKLLAQPQTWRDIGHIRGF
jgi:cytochrome c556